MQRVRTSVTERREQARASVSSNRIVAAFMHNCGSQGSDEGQVARVWNPHVALSSEALLPPNLHSMLSGMLYLRRAASRSLAWMIAH